MKRAAHHRGAYDVAPTDRIAQLGRHKVLSTRPEPDEWRPRQLALDCQQLPERLDGLERVALEQELPREGRAVEVSQGEERVAHGCS